MGGLSSSKDSFAGWRIKVGEALRTFLLIALGTGIVSGMGFNKKADFEATIIDQPSPILCPPCDMIFTRLHSSARGGKRVQSVKVQERGEPKSGTSFSMEWAAESLFYACDYLNGLYGNDSCQVSLDVRNSLRHALLTFEPGSEDQNGAICPCEDVEKVEINIGAYEKHQLPVGTECRWSHPLDFSHQSPPCAFENGSLPSNYEDLLLCMEDAECDIDGSELQMAIFRDPRAMAVSSFYWLKVHLSNRHAYLGSDETIDDYILRMFPILCQWVTIRLYLFEGFLSSQSSSFWLHESVEEPLAWHKRLLDLVGLQLPAPVVQAACIATTAGNIRFRVKGRDKHPGGDAPSNRSYKDEIKESTREVLDTTLLRWVPPTFRVKMHDL